MEFLKSKITIVADTSSATIADTSSATVAVDIAAAVKNAKIIKTMFNSDSSLNEKAFKEAMMTAGKCEHGINFFACMSCSH